MHKAELSLTQYLVWLSLGLLFTIAPVIIIQHPPLADYPNHLARVFVWLAHGTLQEVPNLRPVWALQPNMAFDLIVGGLAQFMPLNVAGRIFIVGAIVSIVLGPAILSYRLHGSFSWLSLLAILFVYNRLFFWGFLGYLFSLGLAIALSALWIRYEPKNTFLNGYPIRGVAALVVLGCHLYAFAVMCLLVTFLIIRELKFTQAPGMTWAIAKEFFLKIIPLTFPLPLFLIFSPGFDLGHSVSWRGLVDKVVALGGVLVGSNSVVDLAAAGFALLMLSGLFITKKIQISILGWAFIGFLVALHFAMPNQLFTSFGADRRLPIAIGLIGCALLAPTKFVNRTGASIVCAVITALIAVRIGGVIQQWKVADEMHSYQIDAFQRLPRQSSIVYLAGTSKPYGLPWLPLTEYAGYAVIERSVFWPGIFAYPVHGAQTIAFEPIEAGKTTNPSLQKIPLQELEAVLKGDVALSKLDVGSLQECFDYVVAAREDGKAELMPASSVFGPQIYKNKFTSIYRVVKEGACPWKNR